MTLLYILLAPKGVKHGYHFLKKLYLVLLKRTLNQCQEGKDCKFNVPTKPIFVRESAIC